MTVASVIITSTPSGGICSDDLVEAEQGGSGIGRCDALFVVVSSSGAAENGVKSEDKSDEDGPETMDRAETMDGTEMAANGTETMEEAEMVDRERDVQGGGGMLGLVPVLITPPLWFLDRRTCRWSSILASRESSTGF